MALGKTHDRINILVLVMSLGCLILFGLEPSFLVSYSSGFIIATFLMSPDLDLGPKKRARFLQPLLFPYSMFFKHRGMSHSLFLGTLTRLIYGLLVVTAFIFVLHRMDLMELSAQSFLKSLLYFFKHFDLRLKESQMVCWLIGGMFLSDISHVVVDSVSSGFKKIF